MMTRRSLAAIFAGGMLFGFGLALATMTSPEVVLQFLEWRDFGLMLVLGGAVSVALVAYQVVPRLRRRPVFEPAFDRRLSALDRQTIVGAAIFGAGWGLCCVCPGPAIAGLGLGNWPMLVAIAGIAAGAYVHGRLAGRQ